MEIRVVMTPLGSWEVQYRVDNQDAVRRPWSRPVEVADHKLGRYLEELGDRVHAIRAEAGAQ